MAQTAVEPAPPPVRRGRRFVIGAVVFVLVLLGAAIWPGPALYSHERITRADMLLRPATGFGLSEDTWSAIGLQQDDAVVATIIVTWTAPLRVGDDCPVRVVVGAPAGEWKLLNVLPVPGQQVVQRADDAVTFESDPGSQRVVHLSFATDGADQANVQDALDGGGHVLLQRRCPDHSSRLEKSSYDVTSELPGPTTG
ncbi:hypothetical protein [Angustibacter luteus]|uniref:Uncharacterized protein n=1 Tax=Angustibacter luteus TaxID=658456 RepID=A0ABW1JCT8_9ACTN